MALYEGTSGEDNLNGWWPADTMFGYQSDDRLDGEADATRCMAARATTP